MIFVIPYEVETLQQVRPWANWVIVGACSMVSIMFFQDVLDIRTVEALILDGFSMPGFFGHVLLHADYFHLIGNMVFLWVFGNVICTNVGNGIYFLLFLLCTTIAALTHVIFDGNLAVGASGAINGVVGLVLAMYPLNRVYNLFIFIIRVSTFSCKALHIILVWLAFDIWGVVSDGIGIAYWAHIGGLAGGVGLGLLFLEMGWIKLTEYDNRSLLDIIRREHPV